MTGKRKYGMGYGPTGNAYSAKAARPPEGWTRPVTGSTRYRKWRSSPRGRELLRHGDTKWSQETGFVDLASATYALDTTGSVTLLATVPNGTSVNARVGKKVYWKSIQMRGAITAGSTAVINDVGFLIVYDARPRATLPALTDILVSASSSSFNNDAESARFTILKRVDQIVIGNSTTVATGMEAFSCDFFLDLKKREAVYRAGGTGAIGDIDKGSLLLVTFGSVAAGTAAASLVVAFRTRYYDP